MKPQNLHGIWHRLFTVEEINNAGGPTIHNSLGIQFTGIGIDYLEATMPVDNRTRQTMGLLHGGASVVLAESLGSAASWLVAGPTKACVGLNINASHLRSMTEGFVLGKAKPMRIGQNIHVWHITISDAQDLEKIICESTLTVMVKDLKK